MVCPLSGHILHFLNLFKNHFRATFCQKYVSFTFFSLGGDISSVSMADTVALMCHTATVVNLSFQISIVGRRNPNYFPFGFSQNRRMSNMCLLVTVTKLFLHVTLCLKAARRLSSQASGILFVRLKWKPHPLCPQMETNSGNTGIAVEIP